MILLTEQNNTAKLNKIKDNTYLSAILYMAPHNSCGVNLCPGSTPGCRASCLNTAGRGIMRPVQAARLRKALLFVQDRALFLSLLQNDIDKLKRQALKQNKTPVVRLNGTTDINWMAAGLRHIVELNPSVQFYDYTKVPSRLYASRPINYHLTLSRSETNNAACFDALRQGFNVAVVFSGKALPKVWHGFTVLDGDKSDYRFLDPQRGGFVVGLTAKGKARKDASGFVVDFINLSKELYQNETV